ncbi:hypothetical protein [Kitasatospora sp. NPDC048407]|uniref:hypothetical protein n=1 Tax=Kitasatospora sp. NPDC048407 TaxID=3364051 RepID=UPI003723846E
MEVGSAEPLGLEHLDPVDVPFDDAGVPEKGEACDDGVPGSVDSSSECVPKGQVVPADRVEPFRETLALVLGEYDGEGADVPGQGVELWARTVLNWSCSASDSAVGRRRIQPVTVQDDGGWAVTGCGEVRFCRREASMRWWQLPLWPSGMIYSQSFQD